MIKNMGYLGDKGINFTRSFIIEGVSLKRGILRTLHGVPLPSKQLTILPFFQFSTDEQELMASQLTERVQHEDPPFRPDTKLSR